MPESALYGVQTLRGIENFRISKFHLNEYPLFIQALAITKMGAAVANRELDLLTEEQADAILKACKEILEGKHHDQFPVDMIQGGAGTTTNMNANEVIANRALELMGHQRGEYQYCSPNDHVNRSQSTNDAYPTAIHIGLYYTHLKLVKHFEVGNSGGPESYSDDVAKITCSKLGINRRSKCFVLYFASTWR